jgi:accessory gene regulator protein AgrB
MQAPIHLSHNRKIQSKLPYMAASDETRELELKYVQLGTQTILSTFMTLHVSYRVVLIHKSLLFHQYLLRSLRVSD